MAEVETVESQLFFDTDLKFLWVVAVAPENGWLDIVFIIIQNSPLLFMILYIMIT